MKAFWLILIFLWAGAVSAQTGGAAVTGNGTSAAGASAGKLTMISPWTDVTTKLLVPGTAGPPARKCQVVEVPAKMAVFSVRPHPNSTWTMKIPVMAVVDPNTQMTNVILWDAKASDMFYVSDKSGMKSYLAFSTLSWVDCFLQIPTAKGNMVEAIAQFEAAFDDQKLVDASMQQTQKDHRIDLRPASTKFYFSDAPAPGGEYASLIIESVDVTDGAMRLSLRNSSTKVPATYWIDLKARKVLKSEVNGQQMDISRTDRPWAVPMPQN
jgi:hypothetical protein